MSHRIEYQWTCWSVPGQSSTDSSGIRFLIGIEGGDNNCYEARTGRRARDWEICMLGSYEQVLKQAVWAAGACEGGSLKPGGRDCTPEAYIRRIRRLLEAATPSNPGGWYPDIRVAESHPLVKHAESLGLKTEREKYYDAWRVRIHLDEHQRNMVFKFADMFPFPALYPHQLARPCGLRSS